MSGAFHCLNGWSALKRKEGRRQERGGRKGGRGATWTRPNVAPGRACADSDDACLHSGFPDRSKVAWPPEDTGRYPMAVWRRVDRHLGAGDQGLLCIQRLPAGSAAKSHQAQMPQHQGRGDLSYQAMSGRQTH